MKILACDPSMSCTGWALIDDDGSHDGRYIAGGYIIPDATDDLAEKLKDLAGGVVARARESACNRSIVETPAATGRVRGAQRFRGTAMTIPIYGAAVGACIVGLAMGQSARVESVPSDEWTRHRVPSCKDSAKAARVEYVCRTYGLAMGSLGPKTYAGNVADAVLIARYAMWRERGLV